MHDANSGSVDEVALLARANFERVVGEVLLFLGSIPPYNEMFLEELPKRVIRPLALKQFELVRSEEGFIVGYRSWAMANDEVVARLKSDEDVSLSDTDWNSGERKVVVDEVGLIVAEKREENR